MEYITQVKLAEALGITNAGVFIRARKLGITPVTIRGFLGHQNRRYNVYTMEQAAMLGYKENMEAENHPLVTEKRWLKLNEWPESVPSCFQDIEEEEKTK